LFSTFVNLGFGTGEEWGSTGVGGEHFSNVGVGMMVRGGGEYSKE